MVLEEDHDDIPLMYTPLGEEGQAVLHLHADDRRNSYYLRQLEKHTKPGEYRVIDEVDLQDEDMMLMRREDWRAFIEETDPETLTIFDEEISLMFEECFYYPAVQQNNSGIIAEVHHQEMQITGDPLPNKQDENLPLLIKMNKKLKQQSLSSKKLKKLIGELRKHIEMYPDTTAFYNYLCNTLLLGDQEEEAMTVARQMFDKFPDNPFAKITYLQLILTEGFVDEVPELLNHQYTISNVFPGRDSFHVSEYVSFHSIMCKYFLDKEEVETAYAYYNCSIQACGDYEDVNMNSYIILEMQKTILNKVKHLLSAVQAGEQPVDELLDLITGT